MIVNWRTLLIGLGIGAIAYGLAATLLWWRQSRYIFFPVQELEVTPAALALAFEEVWLTVDSLEDTKIHGWWIPTTAPLPLGTLLYLHGNGENIGANLGLAHRFQQLGFSVFLFDYRGYGLSQGAFPSEQRLYQDAEVAWQYVTQVRQVPPEQVYLFGHSLGGAIAIELATRQPQAAALIVQSSFTSIPAMAQRTFYAKLFPVDFLLSQRFDSLSKVAKLQMPVFFIHGLADVSVPPEMSQLLYQAAAEPKQLWLVPQATHNNVAEVAGETYEQKIRQFLP
ncbi:alpha/beta hydrolase [Almyronema epifaneia]|uniref:Alpha/beta hydrolase n=1 Tax=Almyronema epifaneia S1 TaxID=2991925 RepID=A0ABW6IF59_9CYAN